jgi:hypothetical protein
MKINTATPIASALRPVPIEPALGPSEGLTLGLGVTTNSHFNIAYTSPLSYFEHVNDSGGECG